MRSSSPTDAPHSTHSWQVLRQSFELHVKKGQLLLHQGDALDVVFVVMRGLLVLEKAAPSPSSPSAAAATANDATANDGSSAAHAPSLSAASLSPVPEEMPSRASEMPSRPIEMPSRPSEIGADGGAPDKIFDITEGLDTSEVIALAPKLSM